MQNLIEILTAQTADLKAEYLENTKEWAAAEYDRIKVVLQDYESGEMRKRNKWLYYDTQKKIYAGNWHNKLNMGVLNYQANQQAAAAEHYTATVAKLAARLLVKGINVNEPFTIVSARIGQNFNTTINHSAGITRAFTIIASGAVQKPHYRYLIK